MTAPAILVAYLIIGCGAAIAVLAHPRSSARGRWRALAMFVLWPFLLPTVLFAEPALRSGLRPVSERTRRIEHVAANLREAWERSGAGETRERTLLEGFLDKLSRQEARLAELEEATETAAISVRPKLVTLREATVREIDAGLALLEEMVAQLTLLRFAGIAGAVACGERDHVEGLLARIEAMASLTQAA